MLDIFDGVTIPGLAIGDGTITLPLWVMATLLAALALFAVTAFVRGGLIGLTVLIVMVAAAIGANWLTTEGQRMQGRATLEARLDALRAAALVPGSPLACLDSAAGDALAAGCEQLLFSSPAHVAAATAYVTARLTLLADGLRFAARHDPGFEARLDQLRGGLERDPFGVVAQVLLSGKGCSADHCDSLVMLRDPTRVRANMRMQAFDALIARHAAAWTAPAQHADSGTQVSLPGFASAAALPGGAGVPAEAPAPAAAPADAAPMPPPKPHRSAAPRPRPAGTSAPVALNPPRP